MQKVETDVELSFVVVQFAEKKERHEQAANQEKRVNCDGSIGDRLHTPAISILQLDTMNAIVRNFV